MAEADGNCNSIIHAANLGKNVNEKKGKRPHDDIDGINNDDDDGGSALMTKQNHNNDNKRRRKKKKKNINHIKKHVKRKKNWIESCSESIHRIPTAAIAPLTCVVTRVELEEKPLLPGLVLKEIRSDSESLDLAPVDNDSNADNGGEKVDSPKMSKNVSGKSNSTSPWKLLTSKKGDDGEDKKFFVPVQKHSSAIGPTKWQQNRKKNNQEYQYLHLPDGDNGDGVKNPYPKEAVPDKFWAQRKRLFSRYDEGIDIGGENDSEMWYSVTPESIANHIAQRMVKMISQSRMNGGNIDTASDDSNNIVLMDLFCGCGGNSIAFARMNSREDNSSQSVKVVAVDNNLPRLKMAAKNAAVYGVDRCSIVFVHANAIEVLNCYRHGYKTKDEENNENYISSVKHGQLQTCSGYKVGGVELLPDVLDGMFLSPPWGGLSYDDAGQYNPMESIIIKSNIIQGHDTLKQQVEGKFMNINGGELLGLAANAVLDDTNSIGLLAYFLPRNTNGVILGQIAVSSGVNGRFEMEQNVVNGKVKTITAYFCRYLHQP
mmetsp:Transcript_32299/g.65956  ORF Transcript_32299/g.65956 Transcript_32299/m.65956 type:complete len:543 (-) Transcript_32299:1748-3376(-)